MEAVHTLETSAYFNETTWHYIPEGYHHDGFLRVIKIHSMPSFGGEVKLLALYHMILWHVRSLQSMIQILSAKIQGHFSSIPCFAFMCLLQPQLWWMSQK
jgi:hypothetical protein